MNNFNNISKMTWAVSIIIFLGLAIAGVCLINKSNTVYNDSLNYLNTAIKTDIALKGKILTVPNYAVIKEGYSEALLYFTLALGIILLASLLPRLQGFSFSPTGGINITLKDLQEQVNDLKTQNNELQSKSTDVGGSKLIDKGKLEEVESKKMESKLSVSGFLNDPQKGRWGGKHETNGRKLSATITNTLIPSLYKVNLIVKSTISSKPLIGLVKFHLHPTFKNPNPIIAVKDGIAELNLNWVYGGFTVGVEADDGKTQLELDLAELSDAPQEFKDK